MGMTAKVAQAAPTGLGAVLFTPVQKHYQANRASPVFAELHGLMVKTSGFLEEAGGGEIMGRATTQPVATAPTLHEPAGSDVRNSNPKQKTAAQKLRLSQTKLETLKLSNFP